MENALLAEGVGPEMRSLGLFKHEYSGESRIMSMPGLPRKIRAIAYIDGYNLYYGLRDAGFRRFLWLDLPSLARSFLRESQELIVTKYFTTRISTPEEKRRRQSDYLEALQIHCGTSLRFYWGHYQLEDVICRSCDAVDQIPTEKKTDVNIAVEMMTDAFCDAFDTAILISADSDLVPAVQAIRRLFPQRSVVAAFPPERHSAELAKYANAVFTVGRTKLAGSQLPEVIIKPNMVELRRPSKWKEATTGFGSALENALKKSQSPS
jgi:uncharacterized LabA/DUF88 family protein